MIVNSALMLDVLPSLSMIKIADYLINKCNAKWMIVIKNTPFIYSLYNSDKLNISSFSKKYLVSFRNRNDKNAEHLLIKNYD